MLISVGDIKFQSHKARLKPARAALNEASSLTFQSHKARLKHVDVYRFGARRRHHFNPTRLD